MSFVTSSNDFTASLFGTLYGSLQKMHSTPRMAPVEPVQEHPEDERKQQGRDQRQAEAGQRGSAQQGVEKVVKTRSELNGAEKRNLDQLKQRDREVRTHEQAHMSAGGAHVQGGPSYSYETGPDGRQYAVGGNVSIDVSKVPGNPEATEEKARTVRKAAMAPANPSAQDLKVAAKATQLAQEARLEMQKERQAERKEAEEEQQTARADREDSARAEDETAPSPRTRRAAQAYQAASSPIETPTPGSAFSTAI